MFLGGWDLSLITAWLVFMPLFLVVTAVLWAVRRARGGKP
jgi:hypothetical protein